MTVAEALPGAVYVLCFLTSAACAWLLGTSYRRTGTNLLLWSAVCFGLLAINNLALIADLLIWPEMDLRLVRVLISLAAVASMIWGFVWETKEDW